MVPDEATIGDFLTFAPEADEGQAFAFLEGASSLEEAVTQFYENPSKFSKDEVLPGYSTAAAKVPNNTGGKQLAALQVANGAQHTRQSWQYVHTNQVTQAAQVRARDEQEMQNRLQTLQLRYRIFNSDIEPEHDTDFICRCDIHQWQMRKIQRLGVQDMWSQAVMYPGERAYNNCNASVFSSNPYKFGVLSPYDPWSTTNSYSMYAARAVLDARRYTISVRQTIGLNASLNDQAQRNVDKMEPQTSIWEEDEPLSDNMASMSLEKGEKAEKGEKGEKGRIGGEVSAGSSQPTPQEQKRASKSWFKKTFSSEHRALAKQEKQKARDIALRNSILYEENGRWPSAEWRQLVDDYQQKVGMKRKIAELRARQPLQYSHLLRAGYFEPIPVAWADQISNPLKFSIESTEGWRGITPAWRGYEDTAEERLYWVLNHREGSLGPRLKPDQISALNMALERMSRAVEPPPQYFSSNDTCHVQHTSKGYSRQVMAAPFMAYDQPETALDDTMILLDVSGSMDFDPMRPVYNQYLITGYDHSTQPKNKDVARAIVRRFVDAMINHSRNGTGYDLTTFANHAEYVGVINHRNFDRVWGNVRLGGGTRVMTGWQKVKQRHFEKHSASATYHPVYGWQAGPQTPMLRLLLLLDGEATDMDEFELDLLGNSWAHVTIFLIGVDGCPHHHRHANELQRISEVNHHVSFVDAQGNTPERLVTHELLKRHLGYDVSMAEFEELEQPPPYSEM